MYPVWPAARNFGHIDSFQPLQAVEIPNGMQSSFLRCQICLFHHENKNSAQMSLHSLIKTALFMENLAALHTISCNSSWEMSCSRNQASFSNQSKMSYLFSSAITTPTCPAWHSLGVSIAHLYIIPQVKLLISVGFDMENDLCVTVTCVTHRKVFTRANSQLWEVFAYKSLVCQAPVRSSSCWDDTGEFPSAFPVGHRQFNTGNLLLHRNSVLNGRVT